MQFLTAAQIKAIAAFRPKEVDYVVMNQDYLNPGSLSVTFWMHSGDHVTFSITPEGEFKR